MDKHQSTRTEKESAEDKGLAGTFEEPRLEFIEPELKDHGDLTRLTHGFFGTFVP